MKISRGNPPRLPRSSPHRSLLPLSWLYLFITKLRRWLYDRGILASKRLPCKVISVGNLTAGGTGKTATVITLSELIKGRGHRVAVVLRGYKRSKPKSSKFRKPLIVSDGSKIYASLEESGDEAYMLARKLSGIPIIVGKDRYRSGLEAIRLGTDVVLLDDGFQHLRLSKDVEILLVDATQPLKSDSILPAGKLRESKKEVKRASCVLITRSDQTDELKAVKEHISSIAPRLPILESVHEPEFLRYAGKADKVELKSVEGKRIISVCGIGNPKAFFKTIQSLKPAGLKILIFPDHHRYSKGDLKTIKCEAEKIKAEMIITTEKDEHKLLEISELPVMSLVVSLKITSGQKALDQVLDINAIW